MRRGGIAVVVAGLAFAFLGAGCGGGGDDAATGGPTRAEFIVKADGICQQADGKRLAALAPFIKDGKEGKPLPSPAEQEELVVKLVLPPFQEEAEELSELTPPAGDEAEIQALIAAIEAGVKKGEADPASVLQGAVTVFGKAEALGREYGLEHCGRS